MKNFSLKALGAFIFAAGLVVAGVAAPAYAAVSGTLTSTSFQGGSSISSPFTMTFSDSNPAASTFMSINMQMIQLPSTSACVATASTPSATFSDCGISSLLINGSAAPAGTTISSTNPASLYIAMSAINISSMSITFGANVLTVGNLTTSSNVNWQAGGGSAVLQSPYTVTATNNNQTPTFVPFTSTTTIVDASSNAISTLPASTSVGAFTASISNPSGGATYSTIGVIFSKTGNTEYFSVSNAINTMTNNVAPTSWSPGSCGVNAISIAGVAQSGSSGILCQKQTWTGSSATAYAVRIYLSAETSSAVSISVAGGVFTSGSAGTYNFRLAASSASVNNSMYTNSTTVPITVGGSGSSSPSSPVASVALNLGISTGQAVAGSNVAITASGLQTSAPYEVVLRSTPVTLASGNASNGSVSSSVTIPSGLEAGWHSLTFTSTASDGSTVTSVTYFKVSSSGTLLASTSTMPAELANTGINTDTGISLLAAGLSLALVGAELFLIARRKRSN